MMAAGPRARTVTRTAVKDCQGLPTVVKSVVNVQAEALPKRENRSLSWARPKGFESPTF
jgi:hypothetical protein